MSNSDKNIFFIPLNYLLEPLSDEPLLLLPLLPEEELPDELLREEPELPLEEL
jgi:hypothetical protein